jgi:hypothetical protein
MLVAHRSSQRTREAAAPAPARRQPPAALLVVGAVIIGISLGRLLFAPAQPAPLPPVSSAAPVPTAPTAPPVRVQVNARPWAMIQVDGVEVGATPLNHMLAPGVHEFEATFPDGSVVKRRIAVGPTQRLVSLARP